MKVVASINLPRPEQPKLYSKHISKAEKKNQSKKRIGGPEHRIIHRLKTACNSIEEHWRCQTASPTKNFSNWLQKYDRMKWCGNAAAQTSLSTLIADHLTLASKSPGRSEKQESICLKVVIPTWAQLCISLSLPLVLKDGPWWLDSLCTLPALEIIQHSIPWSYCKSFVTFTDFL